MPDANASIDLATAPAEGESLFLELKPLADPQTRQGFPARDPMVRLRLALKQLLRAHGWRCCGVSGRHPVVTVLVAPAKTKRKRAAEKSPATRQARAGAANATPDEESGAGGEQTAP